MAFVPDLVSIRGMLKVKSTFFMNSSANIYTWTSYRTGDPVLFLFSFLFYVQFSHDKGVSKSNIYLEHAVV